MVGCFDHSAEWKSALWDLSLFTLLLLFLEPYENVDVVFAVDASTESSTRYLGSVERLIDVIKSEMAFRDNVTRVSLVTFGQKPVINVPLSAGNNAAAIRRGLSEFIKLPGHADLKELHQTLKTMFKNQGITSNGRYLVLILNSDVNKANVDELRKSLKELGVNLLVVDVGGNNDDIKEPGTSDVISIREDDTFSIFHVIFEGIKKSANKEGSLFCYF